MQMLDLKFIKERRIELDLTFQEVADSMGMKHASTYYKYENGKYAFKAEQLPLLAVSLKCEITDFFKQNVAKTEISKKKQVS